MNEIITPLLYGILIAISITVGMLFWQRRQTAGALRPIAGEQLIEQLSEIVMAVDNDDRIIVINEAARRLINRPTDEIVGKTTMDLFPANADLIQRFGGLNEFRSEIEAPGANGTVVYDLNMKPFYDRDEGQI